MVHIKKEKGDLAVAETIRDLTRKEYKIFTPTFSEHLPIDIIAYKAGKCFRIQVKYNSEGLIENETHWNDKNGTHTKAYLESDFDYYAIYIPSLDKVLYPSIKFGGAKITTTVPNSATPFYWWEDFINFTDNVSKKTFRDFDKKIVQNVTEQVINSRINQRKVSRPSKEELEKLLWQYPSSQIAKQFKVSDTTIGKWAKYYKLNKPGRGYWAKSLSNINFNYAII